MSATPLYDMDSTTTVAFTTALARLQGMLRQEVRVLVNFHGTLAGCVLEGRLTRVQTNGADDGAVDVLIDDRHGVTLDPLDTEFVLAISEAGKEALDFNLPSGVVVTLERR